MFAQAARIMQQVRNQRYRRQIHSREEIPVHLLTKKMQTEVHPYWGVEARRTAGKELRELAQSAQVVKVLDSSYRLEAVFR